MKALHDLTALQVQIMDVIWERGQATAGEIHAALTHTGLARKTVGTLLARLEKQGVLRHQVEGREFVYRAAATREEVREATVRSVLQRLFGGSVTSLVSHALEAHEVQPGDLDQVRALIDEWENKEEGR